jgi:hypothetical protein
LGEISGFIHKTREPAIKFRQQRRSSGIYSLGGVALIAEVPQILQPIICLAGPAKGSTMCAGTVWSSKPGSQHAVGRRASETRHRRGEGSG